MPRSSRTERLAYSKDYYRRNRERMLADQKKRDALREQSNPGARDQYMESYRANMKPAKARAYRDRAKLRLYGLTTQQHKAILERQEHQCPVCLKLLAQSTTPSIDHSHATGAVRGVLCRQCNAALGLLEENTDNLQRAIEYLSLRRLRDFTNWLSGATSTTNSEQSSEASTLLD